jgi:hypothetical protein
LPFQKKKKNHSAPDRILLSAGGDEAHDDEQATCSQPWATERREAKIKEVDDTILSYSKSLLISVLVVVLIRIFF